VRAQGRCVIQPSGTLICGDARQPQRRDFTIFRSARERREIYNTGGAALMTPVDTRRGDLHSIAAEDGRMRPTPEPDRNGMGLSEDDMHTRPRTTALLPVLFAISPSLALPRPAHGLTVTTQHPRIFYHADSWR
jgi:hypothetical protein